MASIITAAQAAVLAVLDGAKGAQFINDIDQRTSTSLFKVKAGTLFKTLKDLVVGIDATRDVRSLDQTYDFAVNGGAVGTIEFGTALPATAVILRSWVQVPTAVTSGGAATLAFGFSGGGNAEKILAATGKASFSTAAIIASAQDTAEHANPPVTAASVFIPASVCGGKKVQLTVGTAALTAGKVIVHVEYTVA